MNTTRAWATGGVALAIVAATAWFFHSHGAAPALAPDPAPTAQVQVQTRQPERRTLVETLSTFGDVTPGQVIGVSFPRAGQVTRLTVLPGNRLVKGALLATLMPDPATQLAFQQAVSAMTLAQRELDRNKELLTLRLATLSQVDGAQKAFLDAQSAVASLRKIGGGDGESAVRAPFDGVVLSLAVAQGDRVAAGATLLQFAQVGVLRVQLGIEPAERRRVQVGTPVTLLPVTSLSSQGEPMSAKVDAIQDMIDPKTQLVSALVTLSSTSSNRLVPGMKMRAMLAVGQVDGIAVPTSAVLTDERGAYVFQVTRGKAKRVAVTRRAEAAGWVAVDGLTDPATPVVVLGNYELGDGMAVSMSSAHAK